MMLEDMVAELGWELAGSASTVESALCLLASCTPAVAILDIGLGSRTSAAVARECRAKGTAIVFATGHSADRLPAEFEAAEVVIKPILTEDLRDALERAWEGRAKSL